MTRRAFIIGAPKCGTTSLARALADHPEIRLSVPKEPHYFATDLSLSRVRTETEYDALFAPRDGRQRLWIDSSTWYLYSSTAVPNILTRYPDARFIVMTRDPSAMVLSLFTHNKRHLHEDASTLESAWESQVTRQQGRSIPRGCREPAFLQYQQACALGSQLQRLARIVSHDSLLHVSLDQIARAPESTLATVLDFLDLAPADGVRIRRENAAATPRSRWLHQALLWGGALRRRLGIRRGLGLLRANERASAPSSADVLFRDTVVVAAMQQESELLAEQIAALDSRRHGTAL